MKIYFLFFITLFISCSHNSEHDYICNPSASTSLTFKIEDTLTIQPYSNFTFNDYTSVKANLDNNIVYFTNEKQKQIVGYNITSGTQQYQYNYDFIELPIEDFCIPTNKEAYILTTYPYTLLKHDVVANRLDTILSSVYKEHILVNTFMGDKLKIKNDTIISRLILEGKGESFPGLYKKYTLNREIESSFSYLPQEYNKDTYPLMDWGAKVDHDSITYIAYGNHHFINTYNNNTGEFIKSNCSRSNFINGNIKGIKGLEEVEFQEASNYIIQNPFYLGLYHDKKEKRFYRVVKHSQDLKGSNRKLNTRYDGEWSIIVMNENLSVLGEAKMPKDTFHYYSCFIANNGLYVALKSNDDLVRYGLIKFEL